MVGVKLVWFLALISGIRQVRSSEPVENAVYGDPEIECTAETVKVTFKTQNPFEGHVYVKGHYNSPGCRVDATNDRSASIQIPFNECGIRRERSTDPAGLMVITNIVISFHPMFVTRVDRAYNVKCFYLSAEKQVTLNMDVSMFSTQLITQSIPLPTCRYEVLDKGPTGSPLKYAMVGQEVYHKWTCESPTKDIYCMTVHSCFVDDGSERKVMLLDENGCAKDKYLMSNLYYDNDLQGGVSNLVFKYADKPVVLFQCQIRLHNKEDTYKCQRTSDVCPWPSRGKRSAGTNNETDILKKKLNALDAQKQESQNVDVYSEAVTVLDIEDPSFLSDEELRRTQDKLQNESIQRRRNDLLCMNSRTLGATLAFLVVILIGTSLLSVYFYLKRRRSQSKF